MTLYEEFNRKEKEYSHRNPLKPVSRGVPVKKESPVRSATN
jgi:hypothetical protein